MMDAMTQTGILTTYGTGFPRYTREVEFSIDPEVFVRLEAKSMLRQIGCESGCFGKGTAVAQLVVGRRTFLSQIGCEDEPDTAEERDMEAIYG